jgi:hypothetical protein
VKGAEGDRVRTMAKACCVGALLAVGLGCSTPPAPLEADAAPVAAPAPPDAAPPVARLEAEEAGIPRASADRPWGITIPTGCTATRAWATWMEFRCRITLAEIESFYRFRFPGGEISGRGGARRFTPGLSKGGYARFHRFDRAHMRARLLVFAGSAQRDDPEAVRLVRRLSPRAASALARNTLDLTGTEDRPPSTTLPGARQDAR